MFNRDPKTARIGEEILPLDVGYLPEFFKKKGEVELNYTQNMRNSSLLKLKQVIAKDKKLKKLDCTDEALLVFLNARKYNIDRTVQQLNKYMTFKKGNPDIFTKISFEGFTPILSGKVFTILPWRCQDGCAIGLVRPGNWDPQKHDIMEIQKLFATTLTQTLREPINQINGFKIMYDLQNINFQSIRFFSPHFLYQIYAVAEKVLPARTKEYHVINMGVSGRVLFQIMKMFMSEKMQKRIFIHQSIDELLDFFPKAILPMEYGGDLKEYDITEWMKKITAPNELAALNILSN